MFNQAHQFENQQAQAVPLPDAGESQERFTIRAHRELSASVPDADERNQIVWAAWKQRFGSTREEQLAAKLFTKDRFATQPNNCVFVEHETLDSKGKPRNYTLREIVKIIRNNNERISESQHFSAISDDHTSVDPEAPDRPVIGYAGPYRLGMTGYKNPKFAIFVDEHHDLRAKPVFERKKRRSVELVRNNYTNQMYFDPIAAIGAKAPRLPLPIRYCQSALEPGVEIERYSFVAPASVYPGGSNTHVKEPFTIPSSGENTMAGDNDIVAQVVEAVMQLPAMQWVQQKMEYEASPNKGETDRMMEKDPEQFEEPADGNTSKGCDPDTADINDLLVTPAEETEKKSLNAPMGTNKMPMPSKVTPQSRFSARSDKVVDVERYSQLQEAHNGLVKQHGDAMSRLKQLERINTDQARRAKIQELANQYPGIVDSKEEFDKCLYSHDSKMTNDAFEHHVQTIERFAARAQAQSVTRIPVGELPRSFSETDIERKCADLAVEIHTDRINSNQESDWNIAMAEARKRLKITK